MKKLTLTVAMAAIVSLALVLSSCGGGGGSQSPETVAEKYIAAMLKQDFSAMKKYASEKELKNIEEQEAEVKDMPAEKKELLKALEAAKTEVQPALINESTPDIANVNVNYILKFNGEENDGTWKVKLVKENGDWKVDNVSLK